MSGVLRAVNKQGDALYAKRQSFASSPEPRRPIPAGKPPLVHLLTCLLGTLPSFVQKSPFGCMGTVDPARVCDGDDARGARLELHTGAATASPLRPHCRVAGGHTPHVSGCKEWGEMGRNGEKPAESNERHRKAPWAVPCSQHLFPSRRGITMEGAGKREVRGTESISWGHDGAVPP